MTLHRVLVGVGSNINREYHTREAYWQLRRFYSVISVSQVYDCPAQGFEGVNFYNWAVCLETEQSLQAVHQKFKSLEAKYGRKDWHKKHCSRTMDLDLLCFNQQICKEPVLLPRPEILDRAFVLKPLADIVPHQRHPVAGQTYLQLWQQFEQGAQPIQPVAFEWSSLPA